MMRIVIIVICCVLCLTGVPDWMTDSRWPWLCAAAYPLYHANIFHLTVNMIAVWALYAPRFRNKGWLLLCSWLVSMAVWPLAPHPVVGISNLLYASVGFMTPVFRKGYWRQPAIIIFYLMTLGMVFLPGVAGWAHIASLAYGLFFSTLRMRR